LSGSYAREPLNGEDAVKDILAGLSSLEYLDVSNSYLKETSVQMMLVPSIRHLHMENNMLAAVPWTNKSMPNLEIVNMKGNKRLTALEPAAFRNLFSLRVL
jgi:hypothetical protein